ncbi:hypothetical protein FOZ62_024456 [Perkinsus olseni]|uniref:Mitochondrial porin n=3 Tax=Perkinsus olseni TaxID=32597 RepID=A0A7J6Q421_PEROL|nr:hypothetical protein FOZ62_024456 [Perkinsus olseni]
MPSFKDVTKKADDLFNSGYCDGKACEIENSSKKDKLSFKNKTTFANCPCYTTADASTTATTEIKYTNSNMDIIYSNGTDGKSTLEGKYKALPINGMSMTSKYGHGKSGDTANISFNYKGDISSKLINLNKVQYNLDMNVYGRKTSLTENVGCELYKGLAVGGEFTSPLVNGASLKGYCPVDFDHSKLSLAMGYTYSNYFLAAKTQRDITNGKTNLTASIYSKQGDLEAALQGKYTLYADKPQLAIAAKYRFDDKTSVKGTLSDDFKARALVTYMCGGGVTANIGMSINLKKNADAGGAADTFKFGTKFVFSS